MIVHNILNDIVKKAEIQYQKTMNNVSDATFMGKILYKEMDKHGNIKKDAIINRRIYMKSTGKRYEKYLDMVVNGKKLSQKEMEEEIDNWKKGSKMSETKMPFAKETKSDYSYNLISDTTLNGLPAWIIGFTAKQKKDGYIDGKAYILKSSYGLARIEFTPSKKSSVIDDMELSLSYSEIQGYWLPVKFEMDMKINVKFVLSMYQKHIKIEDIYSQYKLNTGLQDSLFES